MRCCLGTGSEWRVVISLGCHDINVADAAFDFTSVTDCLMLTLYYIYLTDLLRDHLTW